MIWDWYCVSVFFVLDWCKLVLFYFSLFLNDTRLLLRKFFSLGILLFFTQISILNLDLGNNFFCLGFSICGFIFAVEITYKPLAPLDDKLLLIIIGL